jgi:hypothetical protein
MGKQHKPGEDHPEIVPIPSVQPEKIPPEINPDEEEQPVISPDKTEIEPIQQPEIKPVSRACGFMIKKRPVYNAL